MAIVITDKNFEEEVIKSDKITLVDFWAPWCGPCQMMGPIIEDLANETKDQFKIGKLNVDENPEIAQKFQIMSIPTLIIFKEGKPIKQLIGLQSKDVLLRELKSI